MSTCRCRYGEGNQIKYCDSCKKERIIYIGTPAKKPRMDIINTYEKDIVKLEKEFIGAMEVYARKRIEHNKHIRELENAFEMYEATKKMLTLRLKSYKGE